MPTIWIGQRYLEMLPLYEANPLIEEVIVIDNDTTKTDQEIFKYSKVMHLPQKGNIYVNPAWNLGVRVAKSDVLCFANDDLAIDLGFLEEGLKYVTSEFGMLGLDSKSIRNTDNVAPLTSELEHMVPKIEPIYTIKPYFATFFFLHRESYHDIPEEIKIYYGDTFLFEKNKKMGKQNHKLVDTFASTYLGTSSRLFRDVTLKDRELYSNIQL